MITADLPKDAKEKITEDYVRRLEEENAELLRKVVAAKDVLYESKPAKAKFMPGRNYPDMNTLEIDERGLVGRILLPIDAAEGKKLDGQLFQVAVTRTGATMTEPVATYRVTNPFNGEAFVVTEEERVDRGDHFALKSQNAPSEELAAVSDKWHLAFWNAELVEEDE